MCNPPYVGCILHTGANKALVYCKHLGGEKCSWRRNRTSNFAEADLARKEIWNFQLRSSEKDKPRIFSIEDGGSRVLSKNRGEVSESCCRIDRWRNSALRH